MLKRLLIPIAICWTLAAQNTSPTHPSDPWHSLRFLIGTWQAKTQGGTAAATAVGTYTFRLDLGDHVLARHTARQDAKVLRTSIVSTEISFTFIRIYPAIP